MMRIMLDTNVLLSIAVFKSMDVMITGDKDFSDIEIEKPEILTPSQFMQKHMLM